MDTPKETPKLTLVGLDERITALQDIVEKLKNIPVATTTAGPATVAPIVPVTPSVSPNPVPTDYRKIVDDTLNPNFGILVEAHSDAPLFTYTIVVPQKYSTLNTEQKAMGAEDLRPKVLSFADGAIGVQAWTDLVFNNFNPEVRSQIVDDRFTFSS